MGGVFNVVNLHVYHYAGNNPVKYTDPDGRSLLEDIENISAHYLNEAKELIKGLLNYEVDNVTLRLRRDNDRKRILL